MPGVDIFTNNTAAAADTKSHESKDYMINGVYHNPRLDPRNYLEGPLSDNPATRLRQMLARPGIVVCHPAIFLSDPHIEGFCRLPLASATGSVPDVRLKLASNACTSLELQRLLPVWDIRIWLLLQ